MTSPGASAEARPSRRGSILAGLACIAAGAYPFAVGVGWARAQPGTVHAPPWVIAIAGGIFIVAGVSLILPQASVRLRGLLVGLVVTGLALVLDWVAFGPGERHFSGSAAIGFFGVSGASGETTGRVVFGVGAVLLDAFALWAWARWFRGSS